MTTLGQVKINGEYDLIDTSDPDDSVDDEGVGTRWLNYTSGQSFVQTATDPAVWEQTDKALDFKVTAMLAPTFNRVFQLCWRALSRQRQSDIDTVPDSINRTTEYLLYTYTSLFADWTIDTDSIAVDDVDDISGSLEDFEYEDEVYIYGSSRNDGIHSIASVDGAGLTFAAPLVGTGERFLVSLVDTPEDLELIVGRMVWFDVEMRAKRYGLSSERIGTYSYNVGDRDVGGLRYPVDVVAGIDSYLNHGPIADVVTVP